jgi:hypothetical protein
MIAHWRPFEDALPGIPKEAGFSRRSFPILPKLASLSLLLSSDPGSAQGQQGWLRPKIFVNNSADYQI